MPIPAAVFALGSVLLSQLARVVGVAALRTAFVRGGLMGLARALIIRLVAAIVGYWSITKLWAAFWASIRFLWNFNWAITDTEIDAQIKSQVNALAALLGGTLGTTLGQVTCAFGMVTIYPQSISFVEDIAEEVLEEIVAAWSALLRSSVNMAGKALFLLGYKSLRNFLKSTGIASALLGQERAEKWGKERNVVSFAQSWENTLEGIKFEPLRNFLEEFAEEFFDSCEEITMYIANRLDMLTGLQKVGLRDKILGDEVILEVRPNRDIPNERFVVAAREEIARSQVVQTLAQHRLMANRDVGVIIGGETYQENAVRRAPRQISIIVEFTTNSSKPFYKAINVNGIEKVIRPKYEISNIKRSKLDWYLIKQACGGENGYMYGKESITYLLISELNENRGKIRIYAQSKGEAKDIAKALLSLTDSKIASGNASEELDEGNRTSERGNLKPVVRVYPYRCTVIVGVDTLRREGRKKLTSSTSNSLIRHASFPLYGNTKPTYWDGTISELFKLVE